MARPEVKLKHKVQLRKKIEDPEVVDKLTINDSVTPSTPNEPEHEQPKSKSWLWWLLIVLVVIGFCIWYFVKSDKGTDKAIENEPVLIEQADSTAVDSTITESSADEAIPTEPENVNNEGEQDASTPSVDKTTPSANVTNAITQATSTSVAVSEDVESEAMKVIRGDYGVGQERKDKLGSKYQPIQNRVNQLKREGAF